MFHTQSPPDHDLSLSARIPTMFGWKFVSERELTLDDDDATRTVSAPNHSIPRTRRWGGNRQGGGIRPRRGG